MGGEKAQTQNGSTLKKYEKERKEIAAGWMLGQRVPREMLKSLQVAD